MLGMAQAPAPPAAPAVPALASAAAAAAAAQIECSGSMQCGLGGILMGVVPMGVEAPLVCLVDFSEGMEASLAWGFPAGAPAAPAVPALASAAAAAAAAAQIDCSGSMQCGLGGISVGVEVPLFSEGTEVSLAWGFPAGAPAAPAVPALASAAAAAAAQIECSGSMHCGLGGIPVGVEAPLVCLVDFSEGTEASLAWGFPAGVPAAPVPAAAPALATAVASGEDRR
jgi:hypothetical protein